MPSELFPQGGEVARLIREKDWSASSLGTPETWSPSLRTVLRLMLGSRYSMWMGWGKDLAFFYNDAYAVQTLGSKHPWALGRPTREVWKEIWSELQGRIEHVLATGEATWDEGLLLFLERNGYPEETYHTFSYSPAPGDAPGETAGLFCVVIEETERVIGDRHIAVLRDLAASLGHSKSSTEVFAAIERCLTAQPRDLPFSLTYLLDAQGNAQRVSQTGFAGEHGAAPVRVEQGASTPWPLQAMFAGGGPAVMELPSTFTWPKGAWDRPPTHAFVVPIARQGETRPAGVFIAGANPHRPLDAVLRGFVELFVGQVAAGLANADAYEEARKRADALAEIDRAKTAFFSNVSHEFRTPLTLMLGPTEEALGSPERALRGEELETVYRNELRLLKLVNALLDFARIEAGRASATYRPTDLGAITSDLASTFRSAIDRAGVTFEVQCEALPEPIFVDQDMWEKIVLNLLSNALKFTLAGTISIAVRWNKDHAELVVKDTGVGIPEAELPRLFERFHRVEGSRARTHEGSGIGLALVHELVRLHGGTIDVTSAVDVGTTFTISIPSGAEHLAPEKVDSSTASRAPGSFSAAYVQEAMRWEKTSPAAATDTPSEHPTKDAARVLVVDDNADMREYIARLLGVHWTVETASDGLEALATARRTKPDLVLSDVMMPGLDGFGLLRELRADPQTQETPVILLSARAGEESAAVGLRAGADDYVVKPFSASALLVRVEAQLSAARLRDTIRRSAELERQRLEVMFRDSPAAIAMMRGPSLIVELANPLILAIWGKSPAIIGMPFIEALPEINGQGFDVMLQEVVRTGVAKHGREVLARLDRNRDGVLRDGYFDFVYAPVFAADGKPEGVFVHAYEVTDKVLARQNLEQLREAERAARQDAEVANRLKDEFLATMSHELRTPLNAILGWATLLRRGTNDQKRVDSGLATIERNAKTQARLIEDVLDVSRIISGKLRLDMQRVDARSIARAAMDVVRPAADAKRLLLVIDEPTDDHVELVGDADRLQQVIWNLLSNAVKFTPPEGTVSLSLNRSKSAVRIVVQDTGPGIEAAHLPFIFDRFRQVDSSTTRKHGGLGLGLAIVRHLVELHGGSVTAESDGLGHGATFNVHLPIRAIFTGEPRPDEGASSATASESRVSTPGMLAGVRILVADDDPDSRVLLLDALGRVGAIVTVVDSAAAAFEFFGANAVDVLISDISMPEEDGFSLLQRIRALPASRGGKVPAIALTAYARREDTSRALAAGFAHHLAKPADVDQLAGVVASVVRPS